VAGSQLLTASKGILIGCAKSEWLVFTYVVGEKDLSFRFAATTCQTFAASTAG
jgi:hypothetical protein